MLKGCVKEAMDVMKELYGEGFYKAHPHILAELIKASALDGIATALETVSSTMTEIGVKDPDWNVGEALDRIADHLVRTEENN